MPRSGYSALHGVNTNLKKRQYPLFFAINVHFIIQTLMLNDNKFIKWL